MQSTFFLSFAVKYSKMESYELVKAQICNNESLKYTSEIFTEVLYTINLLVVIKQEKYTLHEKYSNTELFLLRIFLYSD